MEKFLESLGVVRMILKPLMKTKLLTVCLLLVTSQVFSEEDPDGLIDKNPVYTDNICNREISKLKKYESVLCEVFRYEFFKYRDRKIDITRDTEFIDYYTSQRNDILGFAYKKNTNKLFIIIADYYNGRSNRRGAIILPLNPDYPDRIYAVIGSRVSLKGETLEILILPREDELPNIKTKNDIKSYKESFPEDCLDAKNFRFKHMHKWWCD